MFHFNQYVPDDTGRRLLRLKEQTHYSYAQLFRWLLDAGVTDARLDEAIPWMSGQFSGYVATTS